MTSGIYIHIPFCQRKCDYCDFFSFKANPQYIENYFSALQDEIRTKSKQNMVFDTIFIGGGTPSFVDAKLIVSMLDTMYKSYNFVAKPEVTIEANPESLSEEKLIAYKESGINRISLGIQSFNATELEVLGRERKVNPFIVLELVNKHFENISLDLVYGLPKQSLFDVIQSIKAIPAYVKHVSCYSLSLEGGTKLIKRLSDSVFSETILSSDICKILEKSGYNRYEISNYAKPGYEGQHNLHYWLKDNYLGFGAGAVSTIENIRTTNTTSMLQYLGNNFVTEKEILSDNNILNETIMLNLRLTNGINLCKFEIEFGVKFLEQYSKQLNKYKKYFNISSTNASLNAEGLDLFNSIVTDFFE